MPLPSFADLLTKLHALEALSPHPNLPLSIPTILSTLLKVHPLFAKAWQLAQEPQIEECSASRDDGTKVHLPNEGAFYHVSSHRIQLIKEGSYAQKIDGLVFETINAIQRTAILALSPGLGREESALAKEYLEFHSYEWRNKILYHFPPLPFLDYWKQTNQPSAIGLLSHTDMHRRFWDLCHLKKLNHG